MIGFTTGEKRQQCCDAGKHLKTIPELYPHLDFVSPSNHNILKIIRTIPKDSPLFTSTVTVTLTSFKNVEYLQQQAPFWKKRKFGFFVTKDRKWGLYRISPLQIVIQARYDSMEWIKKNKIVKATFGSNVVYLDINNKTVNIGI